VAGASRGLFGAIASVRVLNYHSFNQISSIFSAQDEKNIGRILRGGFETTLNDWTRGYYRRWMVRAPGSSRYISSPAGSWSSGGSGSIQGTNGWKCTLNIRSFSTNSKGAGRSPRRMDNLICSFDQHAAKNNNHYPFWMDTLWNTVKPPQRFFDLKVVGTDREAGDKETWTFVTLFETAKFFNGYADSFGNLLLVRLDASRNEEPLFPSWLLERQKPFLSSLDGARCMARLFVLARL